MLSILLSLVVVFFTPFVSPAPLFPDMSSGSSFVSFISSCCLSLHLLPSSVARFACSCGCFSSLPAFTHYSTVLPFCACRLCDPAIQLWNTFHDPSLVEQACRQSLASLGLQYLDLYLIHWPTAFVVRPDKNPLPQDKDGHFEVDAKQTLEATWKAMEV